jgi:hypothetical protein
MLNISQRIPTINDLLVVPCSANIVIRTMTANKIASMKVASFSESREKRLVMRS